ncbi:pilus assembly protein [Bradyrhizobium sp. Arg237L]|uniref:TadE/TadG family type IV pilus assembly protein n=1 Tax=Bradyrhizobium sp. Arg237L TaxID=3003352 RepID=UPI00249E3327|nr:TadE/TadG family type IV pilus assembly protein [Bradyrhizobium sp. Arg237L]MDI4238685.1 pilus assembly protein [Bradyrhizobium sp. Arg237L]
MSITAIFNRLSTAARRFAAADQGNIAVIFALASVPIITFVGAAIDYSRANSARSSMQAALDSTALMVAKDLTDGRISTSDVNSTAQKYFGALYENPDAKSVTITASYTQNTGNGSTIKVDGSGSVTTEFMRLAGLNSLGFNVSSTSLWGTVRMRVAMALDNTGSMRDDGKMGALQNAVAGTGGLIDQLSKLAKDNGDIYISVVPFAKDVNFGKDAAGASNANQPWIDWSVWDGQSATDGWGTCSSSRYTLRSTCKANGKIWTPDRSRWTGCFTDRQKDYDTMNTTPDPATPSTKFPAEEYDNYCKPTNSEYLQPTMALTYDWSALKTRVNKMEPTGNTNQGIGLAWAWMTLGTGAPFNAPAKDPNYTYKDAIILLSDGMNTQNRFTRTTQDIDDRQKLLCDHAKAAGITIYTVQVNTSKPADPTSAVLQYCASGTSNFYLVTSANQTADVFNSIGASLSKLRVAR